ncbi:MAG: hypothetical protein ACYDH8_02765 [Syntrophales bacterium]
MLKVITDEAAIKRCQGHFVRSFRPFASAKIPVRLGHPGASEQAKVVWSEGLGIWHFSRKIADSRYWNGFGSGRPEPGSAIAITCEINFPLRGVDRRMGGAFAQDRTGRLFVVHRGKLGGGRKGIGKSLFTSSYRGTWEVLDDGGEETPVAVIGILQSPRFARHIAEFVQKIAQIKETATASSSQAELLFGEFRLHEELIGARYREQEKETGAECDHGLVVRDLAEIMKQAGLRVGNDGNRDLAAMNRAGRIGAVFQIRTETTLADIHAGATQLLLNGLSITDNPLLLLVLPRLPDASLIDKLKRLNIDILTYEWLEERALFPSLASLLPAIAS